MADHNSPQHPAGGQPGQAPASAGHEKNGMNDEATEPLDGDNSVKKSSSKRKSKRGSKKSHKKKPSKKTKKPKKPKKKRKKY